MDQELCWCGSGKAYADCHKMNDAKIALLQAQGCEVPDREMIKTPEQIAGIRAACKINTGVLDEVAKYIKAGMTTADIDRIVYEYTVAHNAIPAPLGYEGFPKSVCTSINDQVCHGIPSEHDVLRSGDIVNVDVSTIYNGYYADASRMFMIGKVSERLADRLKVWGKVREREILDDMFQGEALSRRKPPGQGRLFCLRPVSRAGRRQPGSRGHRRWRPGLFHPYGGSCIRECRRLCLFR